jgi:hypothetical protein
MKKNFKSLLTIALVVGLGYAANAQKTNSAYSSAQILADLTITLDETQKEIAFGNVSSTTAGNVVLDANGLENFNTGTTTNVARFDIAGASTAKVTVVYDATVTLTNLEDEDFDIIMSPQVVGAALSTGQATATGYASGTNRSLVDGKYYLWVGGSFPQLLNWAAGTYTGTFNIQVEYN